MCNTKNKRPLMISSSTTVNYKLYKQARMTYICVKNVGHIIAIEKSSFNRSSSKRKLKVELPKSGHH